MAQFLFSPFKWAFFLAMAYKCHGAPMEGLKNMYDLKLFLHIANTDQQDGFERRNAHFRERRFIPM